MRDLPAAALRPNRLRTLGTERQKRRRPAARRRRRPPSPTTQHRRPQQRRNDRRQAGRRQGARSNSPGTKKYVAARRTEGNPGRRGDRRDQGEGDADLDRPGRDRTVGELLRRRLQGEAEGRLRPGGARTARHRRLPGDRELARRRPAERARSPAAGSGTSGKLWGSGHGNFSTEGNHGSATVRGTIWLVEDRCDGTTFFKTRRGIVTVRDFFLRKTLPLPAGKTYVAGEGDPRRLAAPPARAGDGGRRPGRGGDRDRLLRDRVAADAGGAERRRPLRRPRHPGDAGRNRRRRGRRHRPSANCRTRAGRSPARSRRG